MTDFHPIYVAAYVGCWGVHVPEGQGVHRDGPMPALTRISQSRIALWIARHLVPKGDPEHSNYDQLLAEAEAFLDTKDARWNTYEPKITLAQPPDYPRPQPPELQAIVWRAADSARRLRAQRRHVARRARTVAYLTALLLTHEQNDTIEPMLAFLDPLDEQLLAEEFLQFASRFSETIRKDFVRLAYRGSQNTRRADLWLAQLHNQNVGLLIKLGKYWRWFEGSDREVLNNVPDEHFEAATASLQN